ncbi:MAG: hypothetical protein H6830_02595 [Planctomycetes bacterium]|nr:hypothetical protein [Planctomycetota bacterium]MCB9910169.1 hypothetical protein [Planctomycetota bacterium]HPF14892.1 hypothetical protein [Planctomycetota bacterium]
MLFSNPELAAWMDANFECAWRSVGDVAVARIDFPDGSVMERTLGGNLITWVCQADGTILDVLPGVMDVRTYRHALQEALPPDAQEALPPDATEGWEGWDGWYCGTFPAPTLDFTFGWGEYLANEIEALRSSDPSLGSQADSKPIALDRLRPFPTRSVPLPIESFDVSVAKFEAIEDPIIRWVGVPKPETFEDPLAEDSWIADCLLHPQALALLALDPKISIEDLSPAIYRLVLHFDVRDPHLGLGRALLGRSDGFMQSEPSKP